MILRQKARKRKGDELHPYLLRNNCGDRDCTATIQKAVPIHFCSLLRLPHRQKKDKFKEYYVYMYIHNLHAMAWLALCRATSVIETKTVSLNEHRITPVIYVNRFVTKYPGCLRMTL